MRIRSVLLGLVLLLAVAISPASALVSQNSRQGVAPVSAEFRPELTGREPGVHRGFPLRFLEFLVRNGFSYTDPFGEYYGWALPILVRIMFWANDPALGPEPVSERNTNSLEEELFYQDLYRRLKKLQSEMSEPCAQEIRDSIEYLKRKKLEEELGNKPYERHHSFPVYLGGARNQVRTLVRYYYHKFLHYRLNRFDGGKWSYGKGSVYFNAVPRAFRETALRRFYSTDSSGHFVWILPDFENAVAASKTSSASDYRDW